MTRALAIACGAMVAAFAFAELFFLGLTNDTDMLLHSTAHWLYDGGLYTRWISVNPPAIYILYALPTLCAVALKIPPALALHGFTLIACGLSVLFTRYLLRKAAVAQIERQLWIAANAIALFVAPCAFHTFADREHYLFILCLPWITQMLLRLPPNIASAVLAAIGLCIKPYNILLLPVMALYGGPPGWTLRQRLLSPSSLVAAGIIASYAALICIFFPEYPRSILPIAFTAYSAFAVPLDVRLIRTLVYAVLAALLITRITPAEKRSPFLSFAAAASVIYLLNAGWVYTFYILCVPLVMLAPALWHCASRLLAVALLAVVVPVSGFNLARDVNATLETSAALNYSHFSPQLRQELQKVAGDNFILLSVTLWPSNIAALYGSPHSVWAYDDGPWFIAWLIHHPLDPRAANIRQAALVQPFLTALKAQPAPVLIVDETPGPKTNIFVLLQEDAAVRRALADYVRYDVIDYCAQSSDEACLFSIWRFRRR